MKKQVVYLKSVLGKEYDGFRMVMNEGDRTIESCRKGTWRPIKKNASNCYPLNLECGVRIGWSQNSLNRLHVPLNKVIEVDESNPEVRSIVNLDEVYGPEFKGYRAVMGNRKCWVESNKRAGGEWTRIGTGLPSGVTLSINKSSLHMTDKDIKDVFVSKARPPVQAVKKQEPAKKEELFLLMIGVSLYDTNPRNMEAVKELISSNSFFDGWTLSVINSDAIKEVRINFDLQVI